MNDQTDIRREIELVLAGVPKQDAFEEKLKRTQEELGRHGKMALARTVKWSSLLFAFGMALGMTGMVYWYEQQPKPQPVVVHSEMSYATPALDAALDKLKTSLEVHFIQQEAALRKMQQDVVKLSTINKARAAQLIEREPVHVAHGGAGQMATEVTPHSDAAPLSIQHMANELGVTSMVVK